jgi:VanZ family protein
MRARAAMVLLWVTLAVVLASVLLPNTGIAWMRDHWAWFNRPMLLIERIDSAVNLVHAILFLLLGMAVRLGLPRWRLGRVVLAFAVLGIATELVQLLVPGRHARVSDVVVDVVAGLLGWAAMRGLRR